MDALRQWQSRAQARSYNILGDAERATLENEYPKYSTPSASWLSSDVFPVLIVFGWGILACGKWLDYAL